MHHWVSHGVAICAAGILALAASGASTRAAAPTLALQPSSGPCVSTNSSVTARGSGFTPGVLTRFVLRRDRDGTITAANSQSGGQQVAADGTYVSTIPLDGCGPDAPAGSTFTISVFEYYPNRTPTQGPGASATFTVTAPSTFYPGLPKTGGGGAWEQAPSGGLFGLAALGFGGLVIGIRHRRPDGCAAPIASVRHSAAKATPRRSGRGIRSSIPSMPRPRTKVHNSHPHGAP